jgi:hypothetical protein
VNRNTIAYDDSREDRTSNLEPGTSNLEKPGKATQSHIKATPKRVDSQGIGTPKPPQSHPNATLKPPQCDPKATPERMQKAECSNSDTAGVGRRKVTPGEKPLERRSRSSVFRKCLIINALPGELLGRKLEQSRPKVETSATRSTESDARASADQISAPHLNRSAVQMPPESSLDKHG